MNIGNLTPSKEPEQPIKKQSEVKASKSATKPKVVAKKCDQGYTRGRQKTYTQDSPQKRPTKQSIQEMVKEAFTCAGDKVEISRVRIVLDYDDLSMSP